MILFILTGVLTWYGKNGSSGFLTNKASVVICGSAEKCTIYFSKTNKTDKKKHFICLHLKGDIAAYPQPKMHPESWDGIILSPFTTHPFSTIPEVLYTTPELLHSFALPGDWPIPDTSFPIKNNTLEIIRLTSDGTLNTAYQCEWEGMTILFVYNNKQEKNDFDFSSLSEKIDLLLISSDVIELIIEYRDKIRPLYTVALCNKSNSISGLQNLIILKSGETEKFHFKYDKNNRLKLVSIQNIR